MSSTGARRILILGSRSVFEIALVTTNLEYFDLHLRPRPRTRPRLGIVKIDLSSYLPKLGRHLDISFASFHPIHHDLGLNMLIR